MGGGAGTGDGLPNCTLIGGSDAVGGGAGTGDGLPSCTLRGERDEAVGTGAGTDEGMPSCTFRGESDETGGGAGTGEGCPSCTLRAGMDGGGSEGIGDGEPTTTLRAGGTSSATRPQSECIERTCGGGADDIAMFHACWLGAGGLAAGGSNGFSLGLEEGNEGGGGGVEPSPSINCFAFSFCGSSL